MSVLSPQDEKTYSKQVINDGRVQLRVVYAVLIVLYGGFGYLDLLLIEDYLRDFLLIRFAIVVPLFVVTLILTFYPIFERIGQYLVLLNFIVGGSGISYMLIRHPDNMSYYGGAFMVIFAGYFLIKLNTWFATTGGLINLAFYSGGYIIYHEGFDLDMLVMLVFFLGSNIIGIVGNYQLEAANKIKFKQEKEIQKKSRKLETRVSEQHETLLKVEKAIESTSDAIGIFDTSGQIFYMNKALRSLTGFMLEELKENNGPEIIYEGSGQLKGILIAVRDGGSWKGEQVVVSRTGEKHITLLHADAVRNDEGELLAFILIHKDITERKKIEEALRLQVNERAAVDAFTNSVSHDLQAPLRRIEGFSEALLEECTDQINDQARDYLERINRQVDSMKVRTDALLKLSRVVSCEIAIEEVGLSALARSHLDRLHISEPDRRVESVVAPDMIAKGDVALLSIVMENLIENAWKFTSGVENASIECGSFERDGKTGYFLKDNGVGFDQQRADKLFIPFQKLHSEQDYPGIGIGLNIVYRIISRLGGEIWAEGEPGKGACIYFTLP